jgi:Type II CAAX prenyl endopeptidase Rce1-like
MPALDRASKPDTPSRWPFFAEAIGLYLLWMAATWLLEGRILTLLRPEAVTGRLLYTLVANLLIGIGGALWLVKRATAGQAATIRRHGFAPPQRTAIAVVAGSTIGLAAYLLQGAPSLDPIVVANAFAQTLPVSIAEILVCWAVLATAAERALFSLGRWATGTAGIIAALLFGLYHLAHSPPFNSPSFVVLLSLVGVATSVFFLVSREIYGTIAFHNFQAAFGVTQALAAQKLLGGYGEPKPALYALALVALLLLIALDLVWTRRGKR